MHCMEDVKALTPLPLPRRRSVPFAVPLAPVETEPAAVQSGADNQTTHIGGAKDPPLTAAPHESPSFPPHTHSHTIGTRSAYLPRRCPDAGWWRRARAATRWWGPGSPWPRSSGRRRRRPAPPRPCSSSCPRCPAALQTTPRLFRSSTLLKRGPGNSQGAAVRRCPKVFSQHFAAPKI